MASTAAADKKEQLVYKARLAEQCDRNEDLLKAMKEVVQLGEPLSVDERNLFSLAFKNVAGALRNSYRVIDSVEQKQASQGTDATKKETIQQYREKIQAETEDICKDAVKLIDAFLIPKTGDDHEAMTFLLKMKADYYRYLAEVLAKLPHSNESVEKCQEFYQQAFNLAKEKLAPTSPMRLGVALNYSVFFYEIANDAAAATQLAKSAFDDGITDLEDVDSEGAKESVVILQLLRDNLALWHRSGHGLFDEEEISTDPELLGDVIVQQIDTELPLMPKPTIDAAPKDVDADGEMKPSQPVAADAAEETKPSQPVAAEEDAKSSQPVAAEEDAKSSQPAGEPSVLEKVDEQQ